MSVSMSLTSQTVGYGFRDAAASIKRKTAWNPEYSLATQLLRKAPAHVGHCGQTQGQRRTREASTGPSGLCMMQI